MDQLKCRKGGLKEKLEGGKVYYEIRLESIGGLGANLCGKMLGELGVKYLDVNSSSFSSYGSEKTGTPVKGYIRYCDKNKEIRVHSPVTEPDLLVVFHQALLRDETVLKGCGDDTEVIIALEPGQGQSKKDKDHAVAKQENLGTVVTKTNRGSYYGLEAQRIAMETHSRINVVMLGAALKVMGIKSIEPGEQICKDTLGKKYPEALKNNLEGMKRGYEEVRLLEYPENDMQYDEKNIERSGKNIEILEKAVEQAEKTAKYEQNAIEKTGKMKIYTKKIREQSEHSAKNENSTKWGYDNAPLGGINPRFGSTVVADLSPSRQGYIPIFIKERCINCGLCHSTCPDMVFQFKQGEYKGREMMVNQGLDYYHCKGCLRCVDVCPVNALVTGVEAEHPKKEYFMENQELLRMPEYYEESGADGYITSESYLTEKRMEGGEV